MPASGGSFTLCTSPRTTRAPHLTSPPQLKGTGHHSLKPGSVARPVPALSGHPHIQPGPAPGGQLGPAASTARPQGQLAWSEWLKTAGPHEQSHFYEAGVKAGEVGGGGQAELWSCCSPLRRELGRPAGVRAGPAHGASISEDVRTGLGPSGVSSTDTDRPQDSAPRHKENTDHV